MVNSGSTGTKLYIAPYGAFSFRNGFLENRESEWKIEENNFYLSCNFLSSECNFIFLAPKKEKRKEKKHYAIWWKIQKQIKIILLNFLFKATVLEKSSIIPHKRNVKLPSKCQNEHARVLRPNRLISQWRHIMIYVSKSARCMGNKLIIPIRKTQTAEINWKCKTSWI